MADPVDLTGLTPVSDPNLIAMLEQPQSAINKGGSDPSVLTPQQQVELRGDALNKIRLARSLKERSANGWFATGFGAQTMQKLGSWTSAGNVAADVESLRAGGALQRVMELSRLNGGKNPLTPLSNSDLKALGDSLANVDPTQGDEQFQRNVGTVEDLYRRAFLAAGGTEEQLQQELAKDAEPTPASPTPAAPKAPAGPGDIGFNTPPPSDPLNPQQEAAYNGFWKANPNASAEQLRAFGTSIGVNIDNAEQIIDARNKGAGVAAGATAVPGLTAEQQAEVERRRQGTDATGAVVNGAADTLTMGTVSKLAAGADALGQSLSGQGAFGDNYSRNLETENAYQEAVQDDHPWAYTGGQVAGGLALPAFGARSATQLAKVGAAYGATYGAGSQDTLGEAAIGATTGALTGAATGWGGGKLLNKLESRAARRAAEVGTDAAEEGAGNAASRYARAQQFGLEPGLDAVGGRGSKIVGNTLSNMPGSAGVMNASRQNLAGQTLDAVDAVAGTYGPTTSFYGMGSALKNGAQKWVSKFEDVASKLYARIPISDKAPANLDNTRQALTELTSIFETNPKMAAAFRNTRLDKYMDALGEEGPGLTWNELKTFRSRIGEEIGDARFSESPTKSELRRLYGALSEDMKITAEAQGPAAVKAFERANRVYREGQQRIDNALKDILGDDGAMTAERAAARVQAMVRDGKAGSDFQKIAAIRRSLPKEEAGEVVNGIIRLLGHPGNAEGRQFAADTFMRNFNDMAPAAKNLLFGQRTNPLRQNLEEFAQVVGNLAERNALQNSSNTAGQVLTGLTFYSVGNIPALLGQVATSYGAARLMTNPKFVRWATGYSKMVRGAARGGQVNEGGLLTQARLLDKLASSEPAIAQEIAPLRDWLTRAANDNVGTVSRATASDGTEPNRNQQ